METIIQAASRDDRAYRGILDKILDTARAIIEARKTEENANDPKINFYVSEFLKWVANIELLYRCSNNIEQLPRETLQGSCPTDA